MRKSMNLVLAGALAAAALGGVAAGAPTAEADPVNKPLFTDPAGDANGINAQAGTLAGSPVPGVGNYEDAADFLGVALGSNAKNITMALHLTALPTSETLTYQVYASDADDQRVRFRINWAGGPESIEVWAGEATQVIEATEENVFLDGENNVLSMNVSWAELSSDVTAILKPKLFVDRFVAMTIVPNPAHSHTPKYDDQYAPDASFVF